MAGRFALVHADVWPLTEPGAREEALLVEGDRVARVGSERSILRAAHARGARVLDAGGLRVLPGLIDSHTHLLHQGLLRGRVDLAGTHTKEAALARVRRAAQGHRGRGPLLAERWDESQWRRGTWPTRDELDAITTRFPLILRRIDGHIAVANTLALRAVEGRLPGVDRDRGLLVEDASLHLNRVWPPTPAQARRAADYAQRLALGLGITTAHDFVTPEYFAAWRALRRAGRLRMRVHSSPYAESLDALAAQGRSTGWGDDRLALGGVKFFADGSIGSQTAALRRDYRDRPGHRGRLNWSRAALVGRTALAARAGLTPSIHAIGDAAIGQALGAIAGLAPRRRRRLRPRLEHFELATREDAARAVRLGVVLSMQPNFVGTWSLKGGLYERRLGAQRAASSNAFRRLHDAGARLAFGSDCMPLDPWWGLAGVVYAPHAAQRLRLEEALAAYASGSAWGIGREADLGSLAPGRRADLVLVEGDWSTRRGLLGTRVRATLVGGQRVHGAPPASFHGRI